MIRLALVSSFFSSEKVNSDAHMKKVNQKIKNEVEKHRGSHMSPSKGVVSRWITVCFRLIYFIKDCATELELLKVTNLISNIDLFSLFLNLHL